MKYVDLALSLQLNYGKNTKKPPQLSAIYNLASLTFKSDKMAPQTTKQLHFSPLP